MEPRPPLCGFSFRAAALAALVVACSASREDAPRPLSSPAAVLPGPVLPRTPGQFSPSQTSTEGGKAVDGALLADVAACANCHDDAVAQWRTSAHAFASFNNPIYRMSVDRLRTEAGRAPSRFCAGCHDVALLVDGAMDDEVTATDRRAFAGVTCRTCHGAVQTRTDGNGSYVLAAEPIPIPDVNDPASVQRHKERAAPAPLRTAELCGTCHRAFLNEETGNATFLAGMDEYGAWSRSGYAGSKLARVDDPQPPRAGAAPPHPSPPSAGPPSAPPPKACQGCHMPPEEVRLGDVSAKDGKIASHRFLGAHTWLASMRGDQDALTRERRNLEGAASIDIAPTGDAVPRAGEQLRLDVVVRNVGVGHRFPGGTLDAEDAWIEVVVEDAKGRILGEAGTRQQASGDDPTAHVLRAAVAGGDGEPLVTRETHRFRAIVYNQTIAPRDAELARYALDLPASLDQSALPLHVTATLRHRTHDLALQRAACEDAKRPRGRAFAAANLHQGSLGKALDPCAPQPVTELARAEAWLGDGADDKPRSPRPPWRRLFDHGLAEQHEVQERLEDGRPSLERALEEVRATGGDGERAMVLTALAWLPAHEGRTADALAAVDAAERFAPGHPALASLRGAALEEVWRWADAIGPLRAAASAAPRDDAIAARLAVALGSAGDHAAALAEAQRGLLLSPRDPDLLRVQALALRALGAGDAEAGTAEQAYLAHRPADDAPDLRSACSARLPSCALERVPVHVHVMRNH